MEEEEEEEEEERRLDAAAAEARRLWEGGGVILVSCLLRTNVQQIGSTDGNKAMVMVKRRYACRFLFVK